MVVEGARRGRGVYFATVWAPGAMKGKHGEAGEIREAEKQGVPEEGRCGAARRVCWRKVTRRVSEICKTEKHPATEEARVVG